MGRLLVALAHPDDESFGVGGVMARAADEGHAVVIVCATRGEAGEIADPALATKETLDGVRERELRQAAATLGVGDVRFLGYRDSGMAGTPENEHPEAFARAPAERIIGELAAQIRDVRPDVVVTFEPGGIYGHPDHMAISRHVTAAFAAAAGPDARLYHLVVPKRVTREIALEAERRGEKMPWDLEGFGVEDGEVSVEVDVRPWIARKLAALEAHATQRQDLERLSPAMRDSFMTTEWFALARGAPAKEPIAGL